MKILPLTQKLEEKLKSHNLQKRFQKQVDLFCKNIRHPSLNTELLEPKENGIYSFRIDKKFRVIFIFLDDGTVQIISITNHYK